MESERPHLLLRVSPTVLQDALANVLADAYDVMRTPTGVDHFDVAIVTARRLPTGLSADITVTLPHEGDGASIARIRVGKRSQYRSIEGAEELISLLDELRDTPPHQPL